MPSFFYQSFAVYTPLFRQGDNWRQQQAQNDPGEIEDSRESLLSRNASNETFDVSETFDLRLSNQDVTLSYEGTAPIEGVLHPIFENASGDIFIFFQSSPTPPSTFDVSTINDGNPISFAEAMCFGAGTLIATPEGARAVEDLAIGDLILTADGNVVPVKWMGRQTVLPAFAPIRTRPVLISAGALGDGLPLRDLMVTADHGMIIDGLVVNASALVNGTTIRYRTAAELQSAEVFYHIETDGHEVILAEGAASETFIDYAGRKAFDNHDEYLALYGADRVIAEMDRPRISTPRLLPPALRARLKLDRARTSDDVAA